jgi:beta-amylase
VQLGTISHDNQVAGYEDLKRNFKKLKRAGVDGVMVDCWWGLVEGKAPQHYEWSGYSSLFALARECGLKLQVRVLIPSDYSSWFEIKVL